MESILSKKIFNNIWQMLIIRGGSIIVSLLLVPLIINYITSSQYGFWLTISSLISWLSFFDIGLGHGLRNNLTKALAKNNLTDAKSYIVTTYIIILLISVAVFLIFIPIVYFLNWTEILKLTDISLSDTRICLLIVGLGFCLQFILNTINSILLAQHKASLSSLIAFIGQALILLIILVLQYLFKANLMLVISVMSFTPIIISLIFTIYFFYFKHLELKPNIKYFEKKIVPNLFSLGIGFFIVQIGSMVLFQTDNFIVSNLFGTEAVTEFNIGFKLFSLITMVNFIILTPYWSAYTEAWAKKDFGWMKKNLIFLRKLWLVFVLFSLILFYLADEIIYLWIGAQIKVSRELLFSLMIYSILITFQATHNYIINGLGKIKIQIILMTLSAIFNLPLSYYLGNMFGLSGIVYSNCFFILILGLSFYFQTNLLILKNNG